MSMRMFHRLEEHCSICVGISYKCKLIINLTININYKHFPCLITIQFEVVNDESLWLFTLDLRDNTQGFELERKAI